MAPKTKGRVAVPAGWKKATQEAPAKLELATGQHVTGVLQGPPRASKLNPDRRYRVLRTSDGEGFYLQGAAFDQAGLMDMAAGTLVLVVKTPDVKIPGQPQPMKGYDVYTRDDEVHGNGDAVPF